MTEADSLFAEVLLGFWSAHQKSDCPIERLRMSSEQQAIPGGFRFAGSLPKNSSDGCKPASS